MSAFSLSLTLPTALLFGVSHARAKLLLASFHAKVGGDLSKNCRESASPDPPSFFHFLSFFLTGIDMFLSSIGINLICYKMGIMKLTKSVPTQNL